MTRQRIAWIEMNGGEDMRGSRPDDEEARLTIERHDGVRTPRGNYQFPDGSVLQVRRGRIYASPDPRAATPRTYTDRWKHSELLDAGYLVVPSAFLRHYSQLQPVSLTHGEALFVLHLMEFKWDAAEPFPSYSTLASRMGISTKMVRRYARTLETKGFLRRMIRTGNTNRFDLGPLFDALLKAVQDSAHTGGRGG